MSGRAGHLDAPVEGGARDRNILQAAFDKASNLVQAFARQYEVGNALVKLEQFVLIGRQTEEIGFFLGPRHRRAQRFAADSVIAENGFALVEIAFLANRIPTRVLVEIDVAVLLDRRPQRLTRALVPRLGGADIIVI